MAAEDTQVFKEPGRLKLDIDLGRGIRSLGAVGRSIFWDL